MNYLPLLTDNEAQFICSLIPPEHTTNYFQKNPKPFAKIFPGFRAKTIARRDSDDILFKNRKHRFISSFIEKRISDWLVEIQKHFEKCTKDGDDVDSAYIHTLPFSVFADNIALYFKLIDTEYPETNIPLLASAVKEIKKTTDEQEKLTTTLKAKESDIENLQLTIDSAVSDLQSSQVRMNNYLSETKSLKRTIANYGKLEIDIQNRKEASAVQKAEYELLEKIIQGLKEEISATKYNYKQFETQLKIEMKKQLATGLTKTESPSIPLSPKDMEEFTEYLGYNLENIGVPTHADYYLLLKKHLSHILFQGIPIIINRSVGLSLMRCIANTLIGTTDVKRLTYNKDISLNDIDDFLLMNGRIVCLDNFIGNHSETELLPLFDKHRNKIIFLTVAYDRTLYFVSAELLKYCHYLNLNHIQALLVNAVTSEDPSTVDETETATRKFNLDSRYSSLLREIIDEFGICNSLVEYKCVYISDEQDLCCSLAFDILPYCIDVLQIPPYNSSARFVKYAGDTGRCSYKNLFKEWFA